MCVWKREERKIFPSFRGCLRLNSSRQGGAWALLPVVLSHWLELMIFWILLVCVIMAAFSSVLAGSTEGLSVLSFQLYYEPAAILIGLYLLWLGTSFSLVTIYFLCSVYIRCFNSNMRRGGYILVLLVWRPKFLLNCHLALTLGGFFKNYDSFWKRFLSI